MLDVPRCDASLCVAGQYADLDYGAMRNKESLLQGHCMYVADMNSYNADIGLPQLLPNASVASVPGQPF